MSVSLGLWHTTQKKVTDSVHSREKKKKKKELRTDSGFATHYNHQTASHAFRVATTDYCLPAASTLGKLLPFQKVFLYCSIRHIHAGELQVQVSVQQTTYSCVWPQALQKSSWALAGLQKAASLNTNIPSHGFVGQSWHSGMEIWVSRQRFHLVRKTPPQGKFCSGAREGSTPRNTEKGLDT